MKQSKEKKILGLGGTKNMANYKPVYEKKVIEPRRQVEPEKRQESKKNILEDITEYETSRGTLLRKGNSKPHTNNSGKILATLLMLGLLVMVAVFLFLIKPSFFTDFKDKLNSKVTELTASYKASKKEKATATLSEETKQVSKVPTQIQDTEKNLITLKETQQAVETKPKPLAETPVKIEKRVAGGHMDEVIVDHHLLLAETKINTKKWNEAEEHIQKVLNFDSGNSQALALLKNLQDSKNSKIETPVLSEVYSSLKEGKVNEAKRLMQGLNKVDLSSSKQNTPKKLTLTNKEKQKETKSHLEQALENDKLAGEANQEDSVATATVNKNNDLPKGSTAELEKIKLIDEKHKQEQKKIITAETQADPQLEKTSKEQETFKEKLTKDPPQKEQVTLKPKEPKKIVPAVVRDTEIKKKERIPKTIRVPGDIQTIREALEIARSGDSIIVSPGNYSSPLRISKRIKLIGTREGTKTSNIQTNTQGPTIHLSSGASGSLISSFNISSSSIPRGGGNGAQPAIFSEAQDVSISACQILNASGNGILIIGSGKTNIENCQIKNCAKSGIHVEALNAEIIIKEVQCSENRRHGIELLNAGQATISNSRASKNMLSGIYAENSNLELSILSNGLYKNYEAGALIAEALHADIHANLCRENQLSGIIVRGLNTKVSLKDNIAVNNRETGILTLQGVNITESTNNKASGNGMRQIWNNANIKF